MRFSLVAALLCAGLPNTTKDVPALHQADTGVRAPSTASISVSHVERRARDYLALLGSPRAEADAPRFIDESFAAEALRRIGTVDRLEDVQILQHELGSFSTLRIDVLSANRASAIVRSGVSGRLQRITFEVEPVAPYKIVEVGQLRTLTGQTSVPPTDRERARMLDTFVTRLAAAEYFSGTVLLARDGKAVFAKAFGAAERRFGVPNSLNSRFNLGSITKLFTAVAIAQLVEQGKMSWTDPLGKFIPGFPNEHAAARIQVKHLLTHTSGLTNTPYPPGPRSPTANPTIAEMVHDAPRNALLSEPGTRYLYNNLGYLLLGRIVEIVSSQDYYDYIRDHVFAPAGMQTAGTDRFDLVDRLSYAYEPVPSWGAPTFVDGRLYVAGKAVPFGGAYATVEDILRFSAALRSGALIRPETFELMKAANPQLGAPQRGYGFSLGSDDWAVGAGRKIVGHGGNTAGVCTEWRQIEDAIAPYTFVILANSGQRACFPVAEYILDLIPRVTANSVTGYHRRAMQSEAAVVLSKPPR